MHKFPFHFQRSYRAAARVFGVTPRNAGIAVTDTELRVRFGLWRVATPLANIAKVSITGPYAFVKTAGPARLTLSDRGLTFATNAERGVFVEFHEPIAGIEPTGRLQHPNLTLTAADCDALARALER